MNPETLKSIQSAQAAVTRLIATCQKVGPLYQMKPKTVAHVSRTSKWLLNALKALDRELDLGIRNQS